MKSENLITWNLPNFVSVLLMLAVLWAGAGLVSGFVRRRAGIGHNSRGVRSDNAGNLVASPA